VTNASTDSTIDLLNEVAEFLEGQADVRDGSYGEQVPNRAMSLMAEVELTIERLKRDSRLGPESEGTLDAAKKLVATMTDGDKQALFEHLMEVE
jgi:hypothetical protein